MIVNFRIEDAEISSNNLYKTILPPALANLLLKDAVELLNSAYDLSMDEFNETGLSQKTKNLLTEDKIIQLSGMRDDGWVTDTAIAMINYVYDEELFKLIPLEEILNYTYTE